MKNKVYTKELKIFTAQDTLDVIRSRPEMYGCDKPNVLSHLAEQLIEDAKYKDVLAHVMQKNDWNIVYAKQNWLAGNFKQVSEKELFSSVVSMPEAGINSMRSEILVNAYAENISLFKDGDFILVKGHEVAQDIVEFIKADLGDCFAVMFSQVY